VKGEGREGVKGAVGQGGFYEVISFCISAKNLLGGSVHNPTFALTAAPLGRVPVERIVGRVFGSGNEHF
jgi:hypothetical protein